MAVKTIYKCDKCGNEQETEKQFWTVGVFAKQSTTVAHHFNVPGFYMQVCRSCLEKFGIYVTEKPEHKDAPPELPSLEDVIRDIVRSEIDE